MRAGLVDRIKTFIESIPRTYTLRIQLPSFPSAAPRTIALADSLRLVFHGESTPANEVRAGGFFGPMVYPPKGERFLEFDANGYSDRSAKSPAASQCFSLAKQFLFIVQASKICVSAFAPTRVETALNNGEGTNFFRLSIPERLGEQFARLSLDVSKLTLNGAWLYGEPVQGSLLTHPSRAPENEEELADAIAVQFEPVRRYFGASGNLDFESVAAAIEWYMDSLLAENDTFAYLAACIGMEALLGSAGHVDGLSKRLADRFAFLLGGSRKDRDDAILLYTKVLNLRGKLVHAKAARLGRDEMPLLISAQQMLRQVIQHELHRIYQTEKI